MLVNDGDPTRIAGRQERKDAMSDGGRAPFQDIGLAGDDMTPGWFIDPDGLLRNLYTQLLALLTELQDHSNTDTETDSSPTTHAGGTLTPTHYYNGSYHMVVTAYAGGGNMSGQLQLSNDGTNWVNGATAAAVVNANGTYQGVISGNDMAYLYHRWNWTRTLTTAWNNVITMHYMGTR